MEDQMKRLGLSFALLLFTAIFALPAQAADKVTVVLDWFVNPDHAALVVARDNGFFAKHGLEVELIAPADPNIPLTMLAAGKADLAVSYEPVVEMQKDAGLPLERVGVLIAQPLNTLIVLQDGPVKSLADLKGKKIGFSVGGFEDALINTMLQRTGLTSKDVTMVNVNFNLVAALMSGQVDAVVGGYRNFEMNELALDGKPGKAFFVEDNGIPKYDELILVQQAGGAFGKTDRLKRFLEALREATAWTKAHSDEAWKIFVKSGKELDNELNKRAWRDTVPLLADDPAQYDAARSAAFHAFLKERGLVKK
jgi:putative hydroxymethylpyrimidine transport system substrate-binding protein